MVRAESVAVRVSPLFCGSKHNNHRDTGFQAFGFEGDFSFKPDSEGFILPPPKMDGWRNFARTVVNKQERHSRYVLENPLPERVNNS
jgi:hypothetical protein